MGKSRKKVRRGFSPKVGGLASESQVNAVAHGMKARTQGFGTRNANRVATDAKRRLDSFCRGAGV